MELLRPRRAGRYEIRPLVLFGEPDRQRLAHNRDRLPVTPSFSWTEALIEPGQFTRPGPKHQRGHGQQEERGRRADRVVAYAQVGNDGNDEEQDEADCGGCPDRVARR